MLYIMQAHVRLYDESEGQGPPIILHTGGGGDGGMWRDGGYTQGLDDFQRILFDHRGHGRSDRPPGLEEYDMERYVEDVVSLLDALAPEAVAASS